MKNAKTLMIQGTTSDAGKTTLVAGLCRLFARKGVRVAPFKPQNMALNSAVTEDGGEIGRSQALQAYACGLEPHTDMNPVLLKPNSDTGAQVIVQGHALKSMEAEAYQKFKSRALEYVLESHKRLEDQYELVMVEGAGSPAEINLRENDVANMGFAEAVDCPVILVADIDRGGVFAHLVGTLQLLSESEQNRVIGFVINRFRGDIALLENGLDWLEKRTGKPVLAVLPYLHGLALDQEDAIDAQQVPEQNDQSRKLTIKVPVFPRISNHTDFDVLRLHPQVNLEFIGPDGDLQGADLIILPGSKSTRADLQWFKDKGFDKGLQRHLRYGGKLMGICGGFQMLGMEITDPLNIEGANEMVSDSANKSAIETFNDSNLHSSKATDIGLGYLDMKTELMPEKQLKQVKGILSEPLESSCIKSSKGQQQFPVEVIGYEIHCGQSTGPALDRPLVLFDSCDESVSQKADGAIYPGLSRFEDSQILGSYIHGIFDSPKALTTLLSWAGLENVSEIDRNQIREKELERLADTIDENMNWSKFEQVFSILSFAPQKHPKMGCEA